MSVMNEVGWLLVVVLSSAGCGGPIPEPKQADEGLPSVEPEPEEAPATTESPDEEPPAEEPPAEPDEPPPPPAPEPPSKPTCAELPKGTCEVTTGCVWNSITKCVDE